MLAPKVEAKPVVVEDKPSPKPEVITKVGTREVTRTDRLAAAVLAGGT